MTPDPSRDELARGIGAAFLVTGALFLLAVVLEVVL